MTNKEIKGTPFTIVERENGMFSIAMANQLITTKEWENIKDAEFYIKKKPWELIVNTMCMVYEYCNRIQNGNSAEQTTK